MVFVYFAYEFARRESKTTGKSLNPERGESILKKGSSPGRVIRLGLGREFNCYLIVI